MRIRQIKPSYWLDKPLRTLSPEAREFYIGLWMLSDDAGWLIWSPERIAAELYPYSAVSRREPKVANYGYQLAVLEPDSPHLVLYSCSHAHVPKMAGHQRIAGKLAVSVKEKHLACRGVSQCEPTLANFGSGRVGKEVGNGKERNGTGRARAPEGAARSEFQERVPLAAALGAKP